MTRDLGFIRGARFYRDGDRDMFQYGIDPNNVIGPRRATSSDKSTYPGEWAQYQTEAPKVLVGDADLQPAGAAKLMTDRPQLDHDQNGRPGGSLPGKRRGRPPKAA